MPLQISPNVPFTPLAKFHAHKHGFLARVSEHIGKQTAYISQLLPFIIPINSTLNDIMQWAEVELEVAEAVLILGRRGVVARALQAGKAAPPKHPKNTH